MNNTWRPPKKSNKKAWRKVEASEAEGLTWRQRRDLKLWDTRAVERKAFRKLQIQWEHEAWWKGHKRRKAEIAKGIQGMDYPIEMFMPSKPIKKGRNSF